MVFAQNQTQDNNTLTTSKIDNLTLNTAKTIEITQNNYDDYFDARTGKIISNTIYKGDTLKIGNITGRAFVIDRPLTLTPISQNDKISNGFIHLIKGSDGSNITNLIINNTDAILSIYGVTVGNLHGIWLSNTNNNFIANNTIRIANSGGVYAMPMGWSSYNRIINNDMKTYVSSTMIMGDCHYNLISHNSLEVLSYSDVSVTNLIYYNPFGHADYYGTPLCRGNIISNNYLKGFCTLPMSIILQMEYANHDDTIIANNTIIKGSYGINLNGKNLSIYGNKVYNSGTGISVNGNNFTVNNNSVSGDSQKIGITVTGNLSKVFNNNISFTNIVSALSVGNNVNTYNNNININSYGIGISINGNNSHVFKNNIYNNHDYSISILASFSNVDNNIIKSNNMGITIYSTSTSLRYYNNSITNNKITSNSYGIFITGLVYNSVIVDNIIETNATKGISIEITDELSNTELDNMVNGVILNSTAIVINDNNFYQYFDRQGYFKYNFEDSKSNIIFLTFLTNKDLYFNDKINVISNKMNNLLFNVSITFNGDSDDSIISDFNFINYDKQAIIIDGVNDISVVRNNFTNIFRNNDFSNSVVSIIGVCENIEIAKNNFYVNSKLDFVYAINAPAINPLTNRLNRGFSKGANIVDNTIIMISTPSSLL